MTGPLIPAFSAIRLKGATIALEIIIAPINSSSLRLTLAQVNKFSDKCVNVAPPPGTIPSSTAARVALIASSNRSFLSFISVSVTAPTRITAIPPDNLAIRSCNFSFSYSVSATFNCFLNCSQRALMFSSSAPSPTIVVLSLLTITRRASPKRFN